MSHRQAIKTTFETSNVIQPIYTGGSVALSQDGRILATTLDEDAVLSDLTTGEQLARVESDGESITTLALTPSASHLVICSRSLSMRIYALNASVGASNALDTELVRTLKPHSAPVIVSTIDRTGTLIATGGADGVVKVWDIRGGYCTHTFHGHSGIISALHFFEVEPSVEDQSDSHRNRKRKSSGELATQGNGESGTAGYRLASGGEDGKVRVWNLPKRKCEAILDSHVSVVRSLDFSARENALVSGSRDKTAIVWDARSWKARSTIPVLDLVEAVGFMDDGAFIFTGGESARVRIWRTSSGKEVTEEQEVGSETEGIVEMIHYPTLPFLLSVHADQTLALHSYMLLLDLGSADSIPALPILRRISGTHDEVIDMAYLGKDKSFLALATNLEDIRIISVSPETSKNAISADESFFFGADVALLKGHDEIIISMDVDWSGHWLATGAKDNTARLWRCDPVSKSYSCYSTFTGHAESVGAVALPHSTPIVGSTAFLNPLETPPSFLVTGSQDKTVKRWIISKTSDKQSKAAYTRKAHDRDINALDTNSNSTLFASASQDKTVKIWSVEDGSTLGVLRGHKRGVWTVKFAPDNMKVNIQSSDGPAQTNRGVILTGSGDKTVKLWSLADFSCLITFEGHTNSILKVLWLPRSNTGEESHGRGKRGVQVASAAADGLVKIWDVQSGEVTCTLDNHTDRVWALAIKEHTEDENTTDSGDLTLVSGGGDGVITFWKDTTTATATMAAELETVAIEQNQRLQNFVFAGNYREAITLALQLNQPGRLLALFTTVVEGDQEEGALSGKQAVDEVIANLAGEQLFTLLLRIRDWNTNARTAPVAQRILWTVVRSYPAYKLADLKVDKLSKQREKSSLKEVLEALRVYTERHLNRMQELVDESYLLDFTLREMDEVTSST